MSSSRLPSVPAWSSRRSPAITISSRSGRGPIGPSLSPGRPDERTPPNPLIATTAANPIDLSPSALPRLGEAAPRTLLGTLATMANSDQIRLLVIEDVPQVASYIRGLLNAQAQIKLLDVLTDGSKAAGQVQQLRPDVVIVDALLQGRVKG